MSRYSISCSHVWDLGNVRDKFVIGRFLGPKNIHTDPNMGKVDRLTEIYLDVSEGEESTIEQQEEQRGNWKSSSSNDTTIGETIAEMRERYGLRTQLSDDQLVTLVKAFFDGERDGEIARRLGDSSLDKTVTRARLRLHLFRDNDTTADFDLDALQECFEEGNSGAECARRLDIGKSTANRYRRILRARNDSEKVDNEYYERFRQYCLEGGDDADLEPDFSTDDGLNDAIEGFGADNPQLQ